MTATPAPPAYAISVDFWMLTIVEPPHIHAMRPMAWPDVIEALWWAAPRFRARQFVLFPLDDEGEVIIGHEIEAIPHTRTKTITFVPDGDLNRCS